MKDVQSGGNHHAKQLEAAMEAIRESEDFTGKFGPVDQDALLRLVTVHETDALKTCPTRKRLCTTCDGNVLGGSERESNCGNVLGSRSQRRACVDGANRKRLGRRF